MKKHELVMARPSETRFLRAGRRRGAFSLVELLVVVGIIALLAAILIPALGGARNSARSASTSALLNQVTTAASRFQLDNAGRMPGYFDAALMGSQENGDAGGLTSMENMLLELSGSGAVITRAEWDALPSNEQDTYRAVFPGRVSENLDDAAYVNYALLGGGATGGATGGADGTSTQRIDDYFTPSAENVNAVAQFGGGSVGFPDLVDPWGEPLIAWVADTQSVLRVRSPLDFARISSDEEGDSTPALFYWNSNAGYLSPPSSGGLRRPDFGQIPTPSSTAASLIGSEAIDFLGSDGTADMLGALLGDPSKPSEAELSTAPYTGVYPLAGRGDLIVMSSGQDAIPFSASDVGARSLLTPDIFSSGTIDIRYGVNFATSDAERRVDPGTGGPVTEDFAGSFDDIISTLD